MEDLYSYTFFLIAHLSQLSLNKGKPLQTYRGGGGGGVEQLIILQDLSIESGTKVRRGHVLSYYRCLSLNLILSVRQFVFWAEDKPVIFQHLIHIYTFLCLLLLPLFNQS
jgi:hypothetical protein